MGPRAAVGGVEPGLVGHRPADRRRRPGVYWFSVDDVPGVCNFCGGTGLFRRNLRPKPAWHAYVRFAR
jgi:hypothetical protein